MYLEIGVATVNGVVREGLAQVTTEQRQRRQGSKPCGYLGEQVQSLRQEHAWLFRGTERRPVWLELIEQGGEY